MNNDRSKTKIIYRTFFPWQDAKEERWLEKMATEGWQLKKYTFFRYAFTAIEPQDYIYQIDYKTTSPKDMGEYIDIFEQSGWEHVCSYGGWQYLRILKKKFTKDIYTDKASKIEKLRRQAAWAFTAMLPMVIVVVIVFPRVGSAIERYSLTFLKVLFPALFILMMLSMIMNGIWFFKLSQRIKEMENDL